MIGMLLGELCMNTRINAETVIRKGNPKKQDEILPKRLPILVFLKDVIAEQKRTSPQRMPQDFNMERFVAGLQRNEQKLRAQEEQRLAADRPQLAEHPGLVKRRKANKSG